MKIIQQGVLYRCEAMPSHIGVYCPGCEEIHWIPAARWHFNEDYLEPTLSPSVLYTSGHYCEHFNPEKDTCWCEYNKEYEKNFPDEPKSPFKCVRCHSFVETGQIKYLNDCSHAFAGKTIDMKDYLFNPVAEE
jgi:hypothetical protein